MSFLIDTDICSAQLRSVPFVNNRFLQHSGGLCISAVTLAELTIWLSRRNTPPRYTALFTPFLQDVSILEVTATLATGAGELGARLLDRGLRMALPDLFIAATALHHNRTLVTHNTQDFVNVSGLRLADWLIP